MYNKIINVHNTEYELLFSFDSDTDLYEKNKELSNIVDITRPLYFDSSWKNKLQYFTKERDIVVFCEDYRFGFKNKHQIKDFVCVDEYFVYGKKNG